MGVGERVVHEVWHWVFISLILWNLGIYFMKLWNWWILWCLKWDFYIFYLYILFLISWVYVHLNFIDCKKHPSKFLRAARIFQIPQFSGSSTPQMYHLYWMDNISFHDTVIVWNYKSWILIFWNHEIAIFIFWNYDIRLPFPPKKYAFICTWNLTNIFKVSVGLIWAKSYYISS